MHIVFHRITTKNIKIISNLKVFITQKRAVKKEHSNTKERRHKENKQQNGKGKSRDINNNINVSGLSIPKTKQRHSDWITNAISNYMLPTREKTLDSRYKLVDIKRKKKYVLCRQ